jgi:hypothetical protein
VITEPELVTRGAKRLLASEAQWIRDRIPCFPESLEMALTRLPLIGAQMSLSDADDRSGLGVDMQWFTPEQLVSEATEAYPGIIFAPLGYVPVGMCSVGSGDPYFFREADESIVRVPHEAARGEVADVSAVEVVAESLDRLLELATLDGVG